MHPTDHTPHPIEPHSQAILPNGCRCENSTRSLSSPADQPNHRAHGTGADAEFIPRSRGRTFRGRAPSVAEEIPEPIYQPT
jgi:hypothetical protein